MERIRFVNHPLIIRAMLWSVALAVWMGLPRLEAAVKDLNAECRKGKVYVTFSEEAGEGKKYNIYRSSTPIRDIEGLKPIATIDAGSGKDPLHGWAHVIKDRGQPLPDGTGLFVYTPKEDGYVYYAVTVVTNGSEDRQIVPGVNAMNEEPVEEEKRTWPGAILRGVEQREKMSLYIFYYWMDHSDWNHAREYYGNYFAVGFYENMLKTEDKSQSFPLVVQLHSAGGRKPGVVWEPEFQAPDRPVAMVLTLGDFNSPSQTWWTGYSSSVKGGAQPKDGDTIVMYTQRRVMHYTQAVLNDNILRVDPNRVYLRGSSMGGTGVYSVGLHDPDLWAAIRSNVAVTDCGFNRKKFNYLFGDPAQKLLTPEGLPIYDWMSVPWLVRNRRSVDIPPCVNSHGSQDHVMCMRMHRELYKSFVETRRGIWGQWVDAGHGRAAYGNDVVKGGYLRFLRNEMYPAFSNSSKDDDYGQRDPDNRYESVPDDPLKYAPAGFMNAYLDWSSKLHDLGLANNDLVDDPERLALTMKSERPDVTADVTPRRLQKFRVEKGKTYEWKNLDTATGKELQNGKVTADENNLLTIPALKILETGNRLEITIDDSSDQ